MTGDLRWISWEQHGDVECPPNCCPVAWPPPPEVLAFWETGLGGDESAYCTVVALVRAESGQVATDVIQKTWTCGVGKWRFNREYRWTTPPGDRFPPPKWSIEMGRWPWEEAAVTSDDFEHGCPVHFDTVNGSEAEELRRGINTEPPRHKVPSRDVATVVERGFQYEVSLRVSIPLAWATLLKEASKHHYDHRCQAEGHHGVINGLYNTAQGSEWPSIYPVTWSDLDITAKVAEQLEYHTSDHEMIRAIRAWLRGTMDAIACQRTACMNLPGSAS